MKAWVFLGIIPKSKGNCRSPCRRSWHVKCFLSEVQKQCRSIFLHFDHDLLKKCDMLEHFCERIRKLSKKSYKNNQELFTRNKKVSEYETVKCYWKNLLMFKVKGLVHKFHWKFRQFRHKCIFSHSGNSK